MPIEASATPSRPGIGCGVFRLLVEAHDAVIRAERHDAELVRLRNGTCTPPIVMSAPLSLWKAMQRAVVHLVDVVAGQDQDDLRPVLIE